MSLMTVLFLIIGLFVILFLFRKNKDSKKYEERDRIDGYEFERGRQQAESDYDDEDPDFNSREGKERWGNMLKNTFGGYNGKYKPKW